MSEPNDVSILYIHMAALGDAIMASPALRVLKQQIPGAHVAVVARTQAAGYFRTLPYVDEVIPFVHERFVKRKRPWMLLGAGGDLWRVLKTLRARRWTAALQWRGQFPDTLLSRWTGAKHRIATLQSVHRRAMIPVERVAFLVTEFVDATRPGIHLVEVMAAPSLHLVKRITGKEKSGQGLALDYPFGEAAAKEAESFFSAHSELRGKRRVMIAFSTKSEFNTWSEERFAAVADHLQRETGCAVILSGLPEQKEREDRICLLMKTRPVRSTGILSLHGVAAVLGKCQLLVALNTGVSHIAAALRVPVVVLNGRDGGSITPWGTPHRIVTHNEYYPERHPDASVWPTLVPRITPSEVIQAAEALLHEFPENQ